MVKYICFQWHIVYGMLCSETVIWNIWTLSCPFLIFSTHACLVCFHRLNWIVLPEVLSYFSGAKLTYLPKPVRESVRIITSDHSLSGSWPHSPYNDSRQLEWSGLVTPDQISTFFNIWSPINILPLSPNTDPAPPSTKTSTTLYWISTTKPLLFHTDSVHSFITS